MRTTGQVQPENLGHRHLHLTHVRCGAGQWGHLNPRKSWLEIIGRLSCLSITLLWTANQPKRPTGT